MSDRPVKRFSQDSWLKLGLSVLGRSGAAGTGLEAICAAAGKTRGSFYAHFDSVEQFQFLIARKWKADFTDAIIQKCETESESGERMETLNRLAMSLDFSIEQGIRQLAIQHPEVAETCREVDCIRMNYIANGYETHLGISPQDARLMAAMEYAGFVGAQQIDPDLFPLPPDQLAAQFLRVIRNTFAKR